MVDPNHPRLSIVRQCRLVSIARSSFYDEGTGETPLTLRLMRIDEQFLETPFFGSRQMTRWLRRQGDTVSRKRVRRLMRRLGVHALFQRPRTSQPPPAQFIPPCCAICRSHGRKRMSFLYLVAVMDWASRTVLSWRLSNTLDARFCVEALHAALERYGPPEIFNSDQGSIHARRLYRRAHGGGHSHLDGRHGPLDGQRVHRAALALTQVRMRRPVRVDQLMDFYNERRPHSSTTGRRRRRTLTEGLLGARDRFDTMRSSR